MQNKLLLTALLFVGAAPASAQIMIEPWQIHEGTEGIIDHPTNSKQDFIDAFSKAKIPTEGWIVVPLEEDGSVSFNPGSSIKKPKQQVDFAYFKTAVTTPETVKDFKVVFGLVDDAARIYVNGKAIPEADIIGGKKSFKTIDLKDKIQKGRNEIVIVQFDQHPPGNTLKGLALEVNGEEIAAGHGALTVTPWQIHQGGNLIDFETKTLDQRKQVFTKAEIPNATDKGWAAAELRKADGDVVYQKRSEVKKSAAQVDFTYFQTTIIVPKDGVKKLEVKYDVVDDGARIYLFNSKHPKGYHDVAFDAYQVIDKNITADFTEQAVEGENRIVVVQYDQSAPGNALAGLHLKVAE